MYAAAVLCLLFASPVAQVLPEPIVIKQQPALDAYAITPSTMIFLDGVQVAGVEDLPEGYTIVDVQLDTVRREVIRLECRSP